MRVEVEMKNEHLRKLRHSLNMSQSDYGNIVLERDELIKKTHQKWMIHDDSSTRIVVM